MIPSERCDFKSMGECACPTGTCQQQPTTPAPVVQASKRDAAVIWAFCIVIALIGAGTYEALRAQEIIYQQQARV
ncbi:hypothetical protein [Rhizobium sp. 21-4511-3d]